MTPNRNVSKDEDEKSQKFVSVIPCMKAPLANSHLKDVKNAKDMALAIAKQSEEIFADHGEVRPAVFFVCLEKDELVIMQITLTDDAQKEAISQVIRHLAETMGADGIGFVSEVWSASYEKGKEGLMPSEREDREESIMVTASWHNGEKDGKQDIERRQLITKIIRNGDNVSLVRDDKMLENISCEGRFIF